MLFGRVSRKIILTHPKTNSSKFSCQTRLELQMALASIVRWNWKNSFLAANPPDEFSINRDKKYPMSTVKYTAGSLMSWAWFSAGGPGHLVQMHGIMDSIKYQQIKNQNLTASVIEVCTGSKLKPEPGPYPRLSDPTRPDPSGTVKFRARTRPDPRSPPPPPNSQPKKKRKKAAFHDCMQRNRLIKALPFHKHLPVMKVCEHQVQRSHTFCRVYTFCMDKMIILPPYKLWSFFVS